MISISSLGKWYGDQTLFTDASFQLNRGERYGLVGANGSGKTTLLNILSGDVDPSEGSVSIPKNVRLGILRQDQFLYEDEEILGVAMMGNAELWKAMVEKEELLEADEAEFDVDRFDELEETIQRHDGYAAEARAAEILEGLGFPTEVHRKPLSTLSGGFKLRVLLAQALARLAGRAAARRAHEPPRHPVDPLAGEVPAGFPGPVVVISHDHRFLDNVVHPHPRRGLPDRHPVRRATTTISCAASRRSGSAARRRSRAASGRSPTTSSSSTASGPRRARPARRRASCG